MRAVVQRVKESSVKVDGKITGQIGMGVLILLGVSTEDSPADSAYLASKIANLRIFRDHQEKMNLSLIDVGGSALVISQFTLYGDCRKGRRPSYINAADPEKANLLYRDFIDQLNKAGIPTREGVFQAMMDVSLINDGPVTLLIDSRKEF